ncbi:MAG TPA: pyruvate, water dikinase regulatory protein [Rhodocyclaceae bacterium]|nr:pyruvate, water dikinase regulatory protein [Rhodocyclaceae bacterium]
MQRTIFFVSDGTGITAEALGHSLLSQFEGVQLREVRMPFVDTPEKLEACLARIAEARQTDGARPIVVTTLVRSETAQRLQSADALVLNFFDSFIAPLEAELGLRATHMAGRARGGATSKDYIARVAAIDFTVAHDDGVSARGLELADLILVGVSRSGKTPTSLYLALQFGLKTANYPLIPEDFDRHALPPALLPYRDKLYGLSIDPERLSRIREERRPGSNYAKLANCRAEVEAAEAMMRTHGIPWLDASSKSIEEIAATLVEELSKRRKPR